MLAMQYSIPLPSNVNASAIRERVNRRRALFDDHAGILHKSFIYSEKEHIYAPFYVWKDIRHARDFLMDDLFKGVIEAFSRHRVRSWIVLSHIYVNRDIQPAYARREIDPVDAGYNLQEMERHEREMQQELLNHPALYMHLLALDADRWEIMRYSLWASEAEAAPATSDCYQSYDVLHVSEPGVR